MNCGIGGMPGIATLPQHRVGTDPKHEVFYTSVTGYTLRLGLVALEFDIDVLVSLVGSIVGVSGEPYKRP